MENKSSGGGGIGCIGFFTVGLTLMFIYLKLTGGVEWSWFWVLSPVWINVSLGVGLVLAIVALGLIGLWIDHMKKRTGSPKGKKKWSLRDWWEVRKERARRRRVEHVVDALVELHQASQEKRGQEEE